MVDFLKKINGTHLGIFVISLFFTAQCYAGPTDDNHIHVEQVNGGDDVSLTINQLGYGNEVEFSFAHTNNVFNLTQHGTGNYIGWVSYWGSGKSWGGDVDGSDNTETVLQYDGATYGRHIWGDDNTVDVYQHGSHTFNLDIHADDTNVELWQEGTGSHYAHSYFYGTADGSDVDLTQKDGANHNAQIRLQGTQPTTLTLLQQGSTNQSYTITNTCYTVGGCTVNVSQGN
jgi:hypothetical protein|tara:strand:+ start:282 stop:968 length:687 start_codon:yes stop_codon:yes gene_type:complete